jgi:HK97 family phage portal protein
MPISATEFVQTIGSRRFGPEFGKMLSPVAERGWHVVQEWYPGAWQADEPVRTEQQLAFFAVYACVTLIARDMGKLRPKLVERRDRIWSEVTAPSPFAPVLRRPNRYQNHIQFKECWTISKVTWGNTYVLIERDGRGIATALYILDPSRVTPLVAEDGSVFYQLDQDNLAGIQEAQIVVPASEIIHDRMNCLFHPLVGIPPLYASTVTSQQGLAIQRQGRSFFANGARPSGILTAPAEISDEPAKRLRDYWNANYTGEKAGGVAVLGDGLKYEQMAMNSTDAQMVEQLKLTAEQVCTAFHVPAFKIGVGNMPTFQNGEILNQIYYDNCLQSHIEQYELCMDDGLGIGEGTFIGGRELGVELDLDGLSRMDPGTQIKNLGEGIRGGVMKPDEARRKLDLPPVPGGDTVYLQQQNFSLAALARRDAEQSAPAGGTVPEPSASATPTEDAPPATDEARELFQLITRMLETA